MSREGEDALMRVMRQESCVGTDLDGDNEPNPSEIKNDVKVSLLPFMKIMPRESLFMIIKSNMEAM